MTDGIVLGSSKIGKRGQVTIPKDARDKFHFMTGDQVLFIVEDDQLIIKKGIL